ncbi:hypothetical protein VTN02DRAFT_439 [Thermoascus thermophilus]
MRPRAPDWAERRGGSKGRAQPSAMGQVSVPVIVSPCAMARLAVGGPNAGHWALGHLARRADWVPRNVASRKG